MTSWDGVERRQSKEKISSRTLQKLQLFATFVLLIVAIGLQFQVTARNADIVRVGGAARDARAASIAAHEALDAAVKQSRDPALIAPFTEMVRRTERIELRLCGGPCPDKKG